METALTLDMRTLSHLTQRNAQLQILEAGNSLRYNRRHLAVTALSPEEAIDQAAALPDWTIFRLEDNEVQGLQSQACWKVAAYRRNDHVSLTIDVQAADRIVGEALAATLKKTMGAMADHHAGVIINWQFLTDRSLENFVAYEDIHDTILPSAYPWLPRPPEEFATHYLDSCAPVLVLAGPPGTGKTRLIRYILAAMSRKKGSRANVIYATDARVVNTDTFFMRFLTGKNDAMVIEDADHILEPRADGNQNLHKFLTASDGLIRADDRKMIFSTNLPNRLNIDEAILRPGRCFACVESRRLTPVEAENLSRHLGGTDPIKSQARPLGHLPQNQSSHSLAELYAAHSGALS